MSILSEYLASMDEEQHETESYRVLDRLTKPEDFEGPDDMGMAFEDALDYNPLDMYTRLDLFNRFDSLVGLLEDGPEKDAIIARRLELVDEAHENMKDERYEIAADYMDSVLIDQYGDLMNKVFGSVDKAEDAMDQLLADSMDEDEETVEVDKNYETMNIDRASSMDSELEEALISEGSLISNADEEDDDEDVFLIAEPDEEDFDESA